MSNNKIKILSLLLVSILVLSNTVNAATTTFQQAITAIQGSVSGLPEGFDNPKGNIGLILSSIFSAAPSSKILSTYLGISGVGHINYDSSNGQISINPLSIDNGDISTSAAIAGSKINPNFVNQNIITSGNTTVGGNLAVSGTGTFANLTVGNFSVGGGASVLTSFGFGTANYLTKYSGLGNIVNSTIFDNGNIGIGNAAPGAYKLNVTGNSNISGTETASQFIGPLSGNATTATTFQTARNIGITGKVTGTATSFNGGSDMNINTTAVDSTSLNGRNWTDAVGANTILTRDPSGYTYANYINSNTANNENPSISQVIVTNGGDGFYRKAGIGVLTSAVQSNASGTWGINVSGNAGTATTAGSATYLLPISGPSSYKLAYTADGQITNAGDWGRVVMKYDGNGQTYGVRVDRADYADSAGSASQLGGIASSGYCQSNGANCVGGGLDPRIGTQTAKYLPKWNGSQFVPSNIYDNSTGILIFGPVVMDTSLTVIGQINSTSGYKFPDGTIQTTAAASAPSISCSWVGERATYGGGGGCVDDLYTTCTDSKVVSMRFGC